MSESSLYAFMSCNIFPILLLHKKDGDAQSGDFIFAAAPDIGNRLKETLKDSQFEPKSGHLYGMEIVIDEDLGPGEWFIRQRESKTCP